MEDEDLVVVAERLWPHEAGMMQGVLEMAGVEAFVKGAMSTGGEIPGPVTSVRVAAVNEARAREILAGVDAGGEPFLCPQCGETSPPGFSECPMCAVLEAPPEPAEEASSPGAARVVIVLLLVALGAYLYFRGGG